MLGFESITNLLGIILIALLYAFILSFNPLPPRSKNYSFIDYLLEDAGTMYARKWGWLLWPFAPLLFGLDPLRNIKDMPPFGWILIIVCEIIILLILYWRYTKRKKRSH